MEYLLIDAYNVINAWGDIFDLENESLEDCRDKFLNMISNYQGYKDINVIVVFDAHHVKGSKEKREAFDNITVVYTKENETADNFIERFVYLMGDKNTVKVVTSDYLEQTTILRKGGIRVLPRELKEEMKLVSKNSKIEKVKDNDKKINTIMSNINKDILDKLEKMRRNKF